MAEFYFDNLAKNLPDAYKKDINSNNYKILEIERTANVELRSVLEGISGAFDIDNASGYALDMLGKRFGQPRGRATDTQYRMMIKSKIVRGLSDGSYKSIIDAICYTFGCTINDVLITETSTPMTAKIDKVPLQSIIKAGFSTKQAEQIIKKMFPTTVALESVFFDGTFEFGASENEYDVKSGFGDVEDRTIGGYFGWTGADESIDTLPI